MEAIAACAANEDRSHLPPEPIGAKIYTGRLSTEARTGD